MTRLVLAYAAGLLPFLVLGTALAFAARHREQNFKTPLTQRLLRPPGESLRIRIDQLNDALTDLILWLLGLSAFLGFSVWLSFDSWLLGVISVIPALAGFVLISVRLFRHGTEIRNCRLGFVGERAVGEELNQLLSSGWKVFHDVEFHENPGQKPFNIDHVIVGTGGVFAIETKTRRKRLKRHSDDPKNEVVFNGSSLVYPWGEEAFGINQSKDRAAHLARWLKTKLGQEIPVQPILALPGWSVIRRAKGPLWVVSGREVASLFRDEQKKQILDPKTVKSIIALVEEKCRDVE